MLGKLVQPGGKVRIAQAVGTSNGLLTAEKLVTQLKLAGLTNIQEPKKLNSLNIEHLKTIREILLVPENEDFEVVEIECNSPNFVIGSSKPLSFAHKIRKLDKKSDGKKAQKHFIHKELSFHSYLNICYLQCCSLGNQHGSVCVVNYLFSRHPERC